MIFTEQEILFLKTNYPNKGKKYCSKFLWRSENSIRGKVAVLWLKINQDSYFFKDFQHRAAISKIGRKRPDQASIMSKLWLEWKIKPPSEKQKKKLSICMKVFILENWHPKWMLGKKHTQKTKEIISANSVLWNSNVSSAERKMIVNKSKKTKIMRWTYFNTFRSENCYSRTKSWKRKDIDNKFFRSWTEANFARYLNFIKLPFEFETKEFSFEKIKKWSRFYICDFYIPSKDIYYEVKWWLDPKSITKFKRMKKYYPNEFSRLYVVKQSLNKKDLWVFIKIWFMPTQIIDFKDIEKFKNIIPNWE